MALSLCNPNHPSYRPRSERLPCRQVGAYDHPSKSWVPMPDCVGCTESVMDIEYIEVSRLDIQQRITKGYQGE